MQSTEEQLIDKLLQDQSQQARVFTEIKAPTVKKWNSVGDFIEGTYLGYELVNYIKPFNSFKLKDANGDLWSFGESGRLRELINLDPGCYIRVTYQGQMKTKKGFNMNDFKIEVSKQ